MHYCDKANDVRTRLFVIPYPVDGGRMWYTWGIARICGYTPFTIKMRSMTDSRYGLHAYISKYIGREFLIIDTTRVGALAASFISYIIRNYLTATPQKTIFVITPGILI